MKHVFLDTSYLKALIDRRDALHEDAQAVPASIGPHLQVTSQMVLAEFLNFVAEKGQRLREAAVTYVVALLTHPNTRVIPQTSEQFEKALARYRARMDKGYSLTDCSSMIIMEEDGIKEVLSADKHFRQAGFKALLLE